MNKYEGVINKHLSQYEYKIYGKFWEVEFLYLHFSCLPGDWRIEVDSSDGLLTLVAASNGQAVASGPVTGSAHWQGSESARQSIHKSLLLEQQCKM